jgi:hypothetical protein
VNIASGFLPLELAKRKLRSGIHALEHRTALPVPILVELQFLEARKAVKRLIHALL